MIDWVIIVEIIELWKHCVFLMVIILGAGSKKFYRQ